MPPSVELSDDGRPARAPLSLVSLDHPLVVSAGTAGTLVAAYLTWFRFGRRVRTVDDLRAADYSPRRLRGTVVRCGDADNFRFFHLPLFRPFLRPARTRTGLAGQTLHVRLAGVDAPELPHFGKPEQPFAREALGLLTKTLQGKRVVVELYQKDRYGRVVGHAYVRRFPFFRRRSVSEIMLEAGYATVYRQAGAVYGGKGALDRLTALEAAARSQRRGMWALGNQLELPADFKRRLREKEAKPP
ncbi:hypothetical protein JCM8097_002109 [Rhodosporidiobolus ruineniae]